jgi:hypothetical protein
MNKKTAVEWLMNEIYLPNRKVSITDIIDQAMEMQKQQIIDAYNEGWRNHTALQFKSAERYYNELGLSEYDKHQEVKKGCTGPK